MPRYPWAVKPFPGAAARGRLSLRGPFLGIHLRVDSMKEHPMTDSTAPDGSTMPADDPEQVEETTQREGRTDDPTRGGEELPNSTTDAAPLSDSTDGGLDGGDPGVEE
jgi:hypothetical protein